MYDTVRDSAWGILQGFGWDRWFSISATRIVRVEACSQKCSNAQIMIIPSSASRAICIISLTRAFNSDTDTFTLFKSIRGEAQPPWLFLPHPSPRRVLQDVEAAREQLWRYSRSGMKTTRILQSSLVRAEGIKPNFVDRIHANVGLQGRLNRSGLILCSSCPVSRPLVSISLYCAL